VEAGCADCQGPAVDAVPVQPGHFLVGQETVKLLLLNRAPFFRLVGDVPVPVKQMIEVAKRQAVGVEEQDFVVFVRVDVVADPVFPGPGVLRPLLSVDRLRGNEDLFDSLPLDQEERVR